MVFNDLNDKLYLDGEVGKQEEMGVWCCLIITYIVIKLVFLGVILCIKAMGQRCTQNERRSTTFDLKNKKSPLWLKIGSTLWCMEYESGLFLFQFLRSAFPQLMADTLNLVHCEPWLLGLKSPPYCSCKVTIFTLFFKIKNHLSTHNFQINNDIQIHIYVKYNVLD